MNKDDNSTLGTTGSGLHPVGTAVGAASGAVTGASIGAVAGGPIGAVVGGAVGAAAGAVAGHGVAQAVNPTTEDAYWNAHFHERPYVEKNHEYADFGPAYRYGWESRARLGNRPFREIEHELELGWVKAKGESKLAWEKAKHATSDAWHRIT